MGYSTSFDGEFCLNKTLSPKMQEFLTAFSNTRRMPRNVDEKFGVQGEFFVDGKGSFGQESDPTVINGNAPPSTQPGLWCQWTPSEDGNSIVWDEGEKFYNYVEWIVYLIHKVLAPNGYVLNGSVEYQGEERGDDGEIVIENNIVTLDGSRVNPQEPNIRKDIVLIIED